MAWTSIREISTVSESTEETEHTENEEVSKTLCDHICEIECTLKKILAHIENSGSSVISFNERKH